MSDEKRASGLHIDDDWKSEAAREKERLAAMKKEAKGTAADAQAANFMELINLIALQAAIALGGYQGPGGERIPPNPYAARHHIDLLEVLEKKTAGNLTAEEKRILEAVLYELRMQYVQFAAAPPPAEPQKS